MSSVRIHPWGIRHPWSLPPLSDLEKLIQKYRTLLGSSWIKDWGQVNLTIHTRSALEELFGGSYEIIDVCEHNSEGVTLVGRNKHWHAYSVVAQKII